MSEILTVDRSAIVEQIKLSGKIPEIVEGILARQAIAEAAAEIGIEITTEELQEGADRFRLAHNLHSSEETYKWLERHGVSLDDFENMIQSNLTYLKLGAAIVGNKVEAHFAERQLDYMGAVVYEILLDDEDEALELFYAIQGEETTFYEVARQYIQDLELRRKGGYRGILHRKDLKPEISAAIFAANPPQILKPIITAKGVHLIWIEEIVNSQLDAQLSYQIGTDLFNQWLKQKMEKIEFEVVI
ncbi:MAG: peptidylprolyl isomerase [Cyanosarcina radialis HA8281-LM2]|jgi:parvulin-like peptidyl-prolyl isomerase|nr:peptidylprolyl isomerase [Cyanosarcina radialis HA8281-LM2]